MRYATHLLEWPKLWTLITSNADEGAEWQEFAFTAGENAIWLSHTIIKIKAKLPSMAYKSPPNLALISLSTLASSSPHFCFTEPHILTLVLHECTSFWQEYHSVLYNKLAPALILPKEHISIWVKRSLSQKSRLPSYKYLLTLHHIIYLLVCTPPRLKFTNAESTSI